jgi:uncharacterized RmlC-like cupin family protein
MNENMNNIKRLYGVEYYLSDTPVVVEAKDDDLYYYKAFIGNHTVNADKGDCLYFLSDDKTTAHLIRGPVTLISQHISVVIRGYMPENKSSTIVCKTTLPYVNGCSTKQVFPPERPGDPTLQILSIPPFSSEQAHHIHSTVRIVYVVSGKGRSIVGMSNHLIKEDLYPGKIVVLQKFSPHHFETDEEHLTVLPLHIFSSTPLESHHPMFTGTHMI